MHGCTTLNSKSSNRTLKKPASFVLASLRDSTYRKGTPRSSLAAAALTAFLSILQGCFHTAYSIGRASSRCGSILLASILSLL
jgi:hypothetical protein